MERKIVLNNKLYHKESILQAIDDFKSEAKGKLLDDTFTVSLTSPHDNIHMEFANYVLGLMKNNGIA